MGQKIEIKVERPYVGKKDFYFCLYVDDQFINCSYKISDFDKPKCKKWLKETLDTKNVQDQLRFAKKIKKGTYTVWKDGSVSKTPN